MTEESSDMWVSLRASDRYPAQSIAEVILRPNPSFLFQHRTVLLYEKSTFLPPPQPTSCITLPKPKLHHFLTDSHVSSPKHAHLPFPPPPSSQSPVSPFVPQPLLCSYPHSAPKRRHSNCPHHYSQHYFQDPPAFPLSSTSLPFHAVSVSSTFVPRRNR